MKKNKYSLIISAIVALMIIPSCMDLNEDPYTFVSPSSYYNTVQQIEGLLVSSLQVLAPDANNPGMFTGPQAFADGIRLGEPRTLLNYNNTANNGWWNSHWLAITNLNIAIIACTDGRMDESKADVKDVLGQAYFQRALNYFSLVQFYGKIPWKETADVNAIEPTPDSRRDVAFIYDKIEEDLIKAFDLMFDFNPGKKARPCKWSAKALLAKVYLTRATAPLKQTDYYAKARDAANEVINCPHYKLMPLDVIFNNKYPNNEEFIFAFQYNLNHRAPGGYNYICPGWPTAAGGYSGSGGENGRAHYSYILDYPEQPRKSMYYAIEWPMYIDKDPSEWVYRYWDEPEGGGPGKNGRSYVMCLKYTWPNVTIDQTKTLYGFHGGKLNPFLRISEMYLCYAEAANMAEGRPSDLAVQRLNAIIDRANKPFDSPFPRTKIQGTQERSSTSMSQADFNKKVLLERRLELGFEHTGYWDVLRTETLRQVNYMINYPDYYKGEIDHFQPKDYLFPIPPRDALTLGNNPGYN